MERLHLGRSPGTKEQIRASGVTGESRRIFLILGETVKVGEARSNDYIKVAQASRGGPAASLKVSKCQTNESGWQYKNYAYYV